MYTVSRTFDNAEEAQAAAAILFGGAETKTKKRASKPVIEDDDDGDLGLGDDLSDEEEITMESIQNKCKDLVKKGKKPEILALLKKYKANGVSELSESKYPAFMEDLSKIKAK